MLEGKFAPSVKKSLREAVGFFCSAPHCGAQTTGYDHERGKQVFDGDAAHIFGARLGAARHDDLPYGWDRHGPQNGIWLCAICHRQVDQMPSMFPGAELIKWKQWAERAHNTGYRRTNRIPFGTNIHVELDRAKQFRDELWPAISRFRDCIYRVRAGDQVGTVIAFSDEAARVICHLAGIGMVTAWGNSHPHWTFIEDFRLWQDELVRLATLLSQLPQFMVLDDRFINWSHTINEHNERVFEDPTAEAIYIFERQWKRFGTFLDAYRGPSF